MIIILELNNTRGEIVKIFFRTLIILVIIILVYFLNKYGLSEYLSLSYLKLNIIKFQELLAQKPILTISIYVAIYILTTSLSLPGATILTLAAGALFGLVKGVIIVSFASTIGATIAFLISRFILRDFFQNKWPEKFQAINKGVENEGAFYLFSLRLIPAFPFFLINILMGLTTLKTYIFFFVSQIGMLLGTIIYVNAGVQLSKIENLSDIMTTKILLSFSLLGVFPLIAKFIINKIKQRKVYTPYKKPKIFDYNMVSIGAGAAGLVSVYIAAMVKAKVAIIEKHKMGGDCLNTGCVPSKAIIKSAKIINFRNRAEEFGFKSIKIDFDFKNVMNRIKKVIAKIEPHDSIERYTKLGVDCIVGEAKIISPWEIEVNGKIISSKNIIIASGASPFVPEIEGIEKVNYLTSNNLWDIENLPKDLLILGAGPIGLELAQSFNRLGSKVTIIEMTNRVLLKEDLEVSQIILEQLQKEGVEVLTNHKALRFISNKKIELEHVGQIIEKTFSDIIFAIGRKANTKGFGLEELGIELNLNGTIKVNEYLQTKYPNIFACGDVAGPYQLTHMASHQAWYCAVNSLFGKFKKFKVDYSVVPWCTYTDPEVATVGRTLLDLQNENIDFEITKFDLFDLDRAIADGEDHGFIKVFTQKGSDKILGATIVSYHASDLIIEFISAMKNNYGLNQILGTIHPYPTMSEANKYVASEWKKSKIPVKILPYIKKFHEWNRYL